MKITTLLAPLTLAATTLLAACGSDSADLNSPGQLAEIGAADAAKPTDPSEMLAVGQPAPDFAVKDEAGIERRLSDYRGTSNLVLIFYPGDDTPGCTKQLCAARDNWDQYRAKNVQLLGVNPASAQSHKEFIDKYEYPFPILVDQDKQVIRSYGAEGMLYTTRTVYGINKEGKIVFAERGMPETEKILAAF